MRHWADWAAPSLILLSLLVSYVKYHQYPIWTPEILVCVALLALAGVGLCLFASLRRETLYPLVIGLLILEFADVNFQVFIRAVLWAAALLPAAWVKPLLGVVFFAFMFLIFALRRVIGRVATAVWGVILVTTILLPIGRIAAGETVNQPARPRPDLPLVLHLVLDEQIGVAGVPLDLPGGGDLRADLANHFLEWDFAVFGKAFSQYSESQYALASLVNAEVFSNDPEYIRSSSAGYRIRRNDWLRSLAEAGYSLHVYESGWIDFCAADGYKPDYCFVYPTNSIGALREYDLGVWTKASLILPRPLKGSLTFSTRHEPQLSTLSCLPALDRLAEDIRDHPRGVAFFVHLLLPHYAYVFDAQCQPRPDHATWANVGDISATGIEDFNSETQRAEGYRLYFQQVRCVMKRLGELFGQMRRDGSLDAATVIVHGDHGSRLATKPFRLTDPANLSDRDMVDHYSTLMAIRRPGLAEGYRSGQESIQSIFARLILQRPLNGDGDQVFMRPLRSGGGTLLSRPMTALDESDPSPELSPVERKSAAGGPETNGGSPNAVR